MTSPTTDFIEEPMWFGPNDQPLFGSLTRPADPVAKGGVVIAPPIGREAHASRFALRALAASLASHGFVSLRLDYHGTGDADGNMNDFEVDRTWIDNVATAVAELRSRGVSSISIVGERLGATIAGVCAARCELKLASLVLWDPCVSGRSFLRETNALEALRHNDVAKEGDDTIKTSEFVLQPSRAAELRRLNLVETGDGPLANRLLVLTREDRMVSEKLRTRLKGAEVEWTTADEQRALLDVDPLFSVTPLRTIGLITAWLDRGSMGSDALIDVTAKTVVDVREAVGAPMVRERCTVLGPDRLFAIVSEPIGERTGPLVVMLNVSNEDHTGPSRLWVDLSRRWASTGLRCVRFDLLGLGASPWTGESLQKIYESEWPTNLVDVVHELSPDDPSNVVLIGLCSGAYLAVDGAVALRAKGVCAINPPVGIDSIRFIICLTASRHRLVRAPGQGLKWLLLHGRGSLAIVWAVIRYFVPKKFRVDVLAQASENGTDVLVLTCEADASANSHIPVLRTIESRRARRPKSYCEHVVPGLDHSMHVESGRVRTVALIDQHVHEQYAGLVYPDAESRGREES